MHQMHLSIEMMSTHSVLASPVNMQPMEDVSLISKGSTSNARLNSIGKVEWNWYTMSIVHIVHWNWSFVNVNDLNTWGSQHERCWQLVKVHWTLSSTVAVWADSAPVPWSIREIIVITPIGKGNWLNETLYLQLNGKNLGSKLHLF